MFCQAPAQRLGIAATDQKSATQIACDIVLEAAAAAHTSRVHGRILPVMGREFFSGHRDDRLKARSLRKMRNYVPDAPQPPFGYPGRCHPILGGNVDARHHCYLCRLGSSIDHFGASRPLASKQSRSNRTRCLPYRASGRRMRVRISAHPLAGSVGPLAFGPLHFEDAQEFISRKHGELGASAK